MYAVRLPPGQLVAFREQGTPNSYSTDMLGLVKLHETVLGRTIGASDWTVLTTGSSVPNHGRRLVDGPGMRIPIPQRSRESQ